MTQQEQNELAFYKEALERVAKAVNVTTPWQLVALAENNTETYVDLLIRHIEINGVAPQPRVGKA